MGKRRNLIGVLLMISILALTACQGTIRVEGEPSDGGLDLTFDVQGDSNGDSDGSQQDGQNGQDGDPVIVQPQNFFDSQWGLIIVILLVFMILVLLGILLVAVIRNSSGGRSSGGDRSGDSGS